MPSPARIRSTIATIANAPEELRELRAFHKALADVTRLRLVQRLAASPATVTELIAWVDLSQPLVSWHLRTLRSAGLIETRRSGREVICSLRRDAFDRSLGHQRELVAWPEEAPGARDGAAGTNEASAELAHELAEQPAAIP